MKSVAVSVGGQRRRRSAARAVLATLQRAAARRARRRHFQQLVRTNRARVRGRRSSPPLRADALPQKLDRHALPGPDHGRARLRIRRARPHPGCGPVVGSSGFPAVRSGDLPDAAAPARGARPERRRAALARRAPGDRPSGAVRLGRRAGRLAARSPADLLDLPGRAFQPAGVHGRQTPRREPRRPRLVVLPAVHPFGGRPRQDPPFAGGGAHRGRSGALGDLSDGREVHVRLRRRPSGADLDRLQGAAASDRSPDLRRCAVPAGQDDPGGIRTRAECAARRGP